MSVLTPIVLSQLQDLREAYTGTEWFPVPGGAARIHVPQVELPLGWSKPSVDVRFVLPVGYPAARPDCFWVDLDLRLASGRMPQNTGSNVLPGTSETLLWFSWHVQQWHPNSHTAMTWLRVVRKRFELIQ